MAKKSENEYDFPEIKLGKNEKTAKLLTYFVQGILFIITAATVIAILYFVGALIV